MTAAPNCRDPWIGEVLRSRFRLVAQIGAGGMGIVYRAWDLHDDRYVVVKMPKRELLGDPEFLARFEQELSTLQTLSHKSVVPISDVGSERDTPFAVMPYLAGGSLKQRIRLHPDGRAQPDDPSILWRWLPAIAHALDEVHANGFVHRDVKPDNILFDGLGRPYLSDFGVAKLVLQEEDAALTRGLTRTGFALGTPDYMAPELVTGTKPDAFVDQYALAVVVYELLAGFKPFQGPTPAAVMIAHATTQPQPLRAIRPELPAGVTDAIARGMAKKPAERFDRCIEFAAAVVTSLPKPTTATKTKLMCPQCGRLLTVQHEWAGKKGNCPRCETAITIGADLHSLWIPSDREGALASVGETAQTFSATPSIPIAIDVGASPPSSRHRGSRKTSRAAAASSFGFPFVVLLCGLGFVTGGGVYFATQSPPGSIDRLPAKNDTQPKPAEPQAPPGEVPSLDPPVLSSTAPRIPSAPPDRVVTITIAPAVEKATTERRQLQPEPFPNLAPPSWDAVPIAPAADRPSGSRSRLKLPGRATATSMFAGRTDAVMKNHFLKVYGGSGRTEQAVADGLQWLANHQLPDGSWTLNLPICPQCRGQCANGSDHKRGAPTAATSMALLCFLGNGHTHLRGGPYKETVKRAMDRLTFAARTGRGQCYVKPEDMYSQGFAVLALAEAYAMTSNRSLKDSLQSAAGYLMVAQDPQGGGWRYAPRQPGDMSASGWQISALSAAAIAGVNVPKPVFQRASFFLDSVQEHGGLAYGYSGRGDGPVTSAIGLYCRTLLGWESDSVSVRAGIDRLWSAARSRDLYFQYYATNLMRKNGGPLWDTWNPDIRDVLLQQQAKAGHQRGSWHEGFAAGHAPSSGGRLYCTAMAILILESYYRYAYPHDFEGPS